MAWEGERRTLSAEYVTSSVALDGLEDLLPFRPWEVTDDQHIRAIHARELLQLSERCLG